MKSKPPDIVRYLLGHTPEFVKSYGELQTRQVVNVHLHL
jgi:hypothetical protein